MPRIALLLKVPGYSKGVGKSISRLLFENTKAFSEFLRKDGIKHEAESRRGTAHVTGHGGHTAGQRLRAPALSASTHCSAFRALGPSCVSLSP